MSTPLGVPTQNTIQHTTSALVAASRTGDQAAWDELVRRFDGLVRSTIRSFRIYGADAEDTAQNAWLRLVENVGKVQQPERMAAWLVTTTRRECLATMRRRRREVPVDVVHDVLPDPRRTPEEDVVAGDVRRALGSELAGLPERRRAVVAALFLEAINSYSDVSRSTGLPVGSIGPTRGRALAELRAGLHRRGYLTA